IRVRDRLKYPMKIQGFKFSPTYKNWIITDLIYTIEWLKTFAFFQRLTEAEKTIHVKSVSRMVALFTAAFWSDDERGSEVTVMPDGMILIQGELPREAKMDRAPFTSRSFNAFVHYVWINMSTCCSRESWLVNRVSIRREARERARLR
ncbi:hypothetical protein PENTCL1PPCAC_14398, partial [Pristionchus entomophagus]